MSHHKLFFAAVASLAIALSACDEGSSNNLECDATYVPECMSRDKIMVCGEDTEGKPMLVVNECGAGNFCQIKEVNGIYTAACVPGSATGGSSDAATSCTHESPVCVGNNIETCVAGAAVTTECKNGCAEGACIQDTPAPAACSDVCLNDTTLYKCDAATGSYTEVACENGCENNACKTAAPAGCAIDVCISDTTLYKCDAATGEYSEVACENGCDQTTNACK